jgi:DNA polymerase
VETELAIQAKLAKFPVPDEVWDEYHIDQEINDRGISVDMTMVRQAIAIDSQSRERLMALMREMTELDNPNSVQQMKQWLSDNGLETDTLGKKAVKELLKTAPAPLGEVLSLRQQLAKSSVKKYQAMENAVCVDGRARGMFQFYGANRTGRFAGRLVQLQNLPQNHLPDLEEARALVRIGDYAALDMLYDSVPEVLSELINYKTY